MDFALIGNVRSYARMVNLKFAAKHRIKTGQSLVNANGQLNFSSLGRSTINQMMKSQSTSADAATKKRLAAIKKKLMNGKKLSNEEMGFLLKNDSKLYNKAKKAEEAREELKSDLRQAKSKEEARKALTRAIMKASAAATAEIDAATKASGAGGGGGSFDGISSVGFDGGSVGDISSSEATAGEQISSTANTFADPKLSTDEQNGLGQQTSPLGNASSTDEKMTKDDILEKFIMIIRALEDEWRTFTKSKAYKDLPDEIDEVKLDRRRENAIAKYRSAMSLSIVES